MANSLVRHFLHDGFDAVVGIAKRGGTHGVSDQQVADRSQVTVHRFYDVSFTDEPNDRTIRCNDGHSADVVVEKETNRARYFILWTHGDDPLTTDQISNVHFEPPDIQRDIRSVLARFWWCTEPVSRRIYPGPRPAHGQGSPDTSVGFFRGSPYPDSFVRPTEARISESYLQRSSMAHCCADRRTGPRVTREER